MEERLQKIIARSGIVSRRKAEEYIVEGRVKVNGQLVTELGAKADPTRDHIKVDGKVLRPETFEYYAVHKPRSVLSAASDERGRPLVTELVRSSKRLYPAGRLDFNSEGLVILTNDGELAQRITRAGTIAKVYRVKVRGQPEERQLERLRRGMRLEGEKLAPCQVQMRKIDNNTWLEVVLRQGLNRQIRRMFEAIGHPVMRLRRIAVGPVKLGLLAPRAYRELTVEEISQLKGEKVIPAPTRPRSSRAPVRARKAAAHPRRSSRSTESRAKSAERPARSPERSGRISEKPVSARSSRPVRQTMEGKARPAAKPAKRSRPGKASTGSGPRAGEGRTPRTALARTAGGRSRRAPLRDKGKSRQRSS